MFSEERQKQITADLTRKGRVEVAELAQRYGVSEHTIRRDLHALSQQGLLQKTHGGAVSLNVSQLDYATRTITLSENKEQIGQIANTLIEAGQTLMLEAGTTTLALARQLTVSPLTIITNSLDIAHLFENREDVTLIISGGQWDVQVRAFRGAIAQDNISHQRADWAILGTCALHPHLGATVTNEDDAHIKRSMIAVSARVMILADHSKAEQVAPHLVLPVEKLDVVVTDQPWPELEEIGAKVIYQVGQTALQSELEQVELEQSEPEKVKEL